MAPYLLLHAVRLDCWDFFFCIWTKRKHGVVSSLSRTETRQGSDVFTSIDTFKGEIILGPKNCSILFCMKKTKITGTKKISQRAKIKHRERQKENRKQPFLCLFFWFLPKKKEKKETGTGTGINLGPNNYFPLVNSWDRLHSKTDK